MQWATCAAAELQTQSCNNYSYCRSWWMPLLYRENKWSLFSPALNIGRDSSSSSNNRSRSSSLMHISSTAPTTSRSLSNKTQAMSSSLMISIVTLPLPPAVLATRLRQCRPQPRTHHHHNNNNHHYYAQRDCEPQCSRNILRQVLHQWRLLCIAVVKEKSANVIAVTVLVML